VIDIEDVSRFDQCDLDQRVHRNQTTNALI